MLLLCNPENEIIVFQPFYANYNGLSIISGVKLVPVTLDPKEDYHLPEKEKIVEKIGEKTRSSLPSLWRLHLSPSAGWLQSKLPHSSDNYGIPWFKRKFFYLWFP